MKFRKKPVIVEAEQFFPDKPLPFSDRGPVVCFDDDIGGFYVTTIHGQTAILAPGDFVILEPKGKWLAYPCKPDIFYATYEAVAPEVCHRCEGTGKAYGADRPFEWSGPGTYPGPCPVCKGTGNEP